MSAPAITAALEAAFLAAGLGVQRGCTLHEAGIACELFAWGSAAQKLFGVIGWDDYYFVADADRQALHAVDRLRALHAATRRFANARYARHPALRFTAPVIVTIALSESGFPQGLAAYVEKTDHATFVGGEANVVILVDLARRAVIAHEHHAKSRIAMPAGRVTAAVRVACEQALAFPVRAPGR